MRGCATLLAIGVGVQLATCKGCTHAQITRKTEMETMLIDIYMICLYRLVLIFVIDAVTAGVLKFIYARSVGEGAPGIYLLP